MDIWGLVRPIFVRKERWGDPDRMSGTVLLIAYYIRKEMGCEFIVHCGCEAEGHSLTGYHPKGGAIDGHFNTTMPIKNQAEKVDQILSRLQINCGLGVYPDWNNPGFHIDDRPQRVRWGHVDGRYEYDMLKVRRYLERKRK